MLTLDRYLTKEIAKPLFLILAVLVAIFVSYTAIQYLADAASGLISGRTVVSLLLLKVAIALEVLLPITLYLSVVLSFGRLYADSEMTALSSTGVRSYVVLRNVSRLSLVLAVLVAGLSIYVRPWAYERSYRLKLQAKTDVDISRFEAGRFYELGGSGHVVFVEEMDHQEKRAKRVFLQMEEGGRIQVACAAEAYQTVDDQTGQQILVFADGFAYEFDRSEGRDQSMRFKEFSLPAAQKRTTPRYRLKAAPTIQLARSSDPEDVAEAQWRFSTSVSTVLLGFLGLVLGRTSPRRGKYSRVFLAIVVYAIYYNVSLLARHWVEQGVLGSIPGVWWVHGLVFGFILFALWHQGLAFRRANV